tara:strand:+ start:664 stop:873 length:210 start_codon:yes stop_codon:yes gene_type:complete
MGYYKKLAIMLEEQRLAELYEGANLELIILEARRREEQEKLFEQEQVIQEAINEDKEKNGFDSRTTEKP